jgi:hypothetical protein
VLDPFAGLCTVPYMAIKLGRFGIGVELSEAYWQCGVRYCREREAQVRTPTLFDYLQSQAEEQLPGRDDVRAAER